ncbi:MAG: signal peptidase [Actinomycetia bacterium]|nr:signal peptidase [Actinomycetes bacterium]
MTTQEQPRVTTGTATRRRPSDYRLRGLDLNARALAEPAPGAIPKPRRSRRRWGRLLVQWVVALALIAIVVAALRAWVVQPYRVSSTSMMPTFQVGTTVLVGKSAVMPGSLAAGDIVVFHQPKGSSCNASGGASRDLMSRVIGLPGQTIWSSGSAIYIDGKRFHERGWYNQPYGELAASPIPLTRIPAGSYFVMGDNRTDTCDSRAFGPVPKSLVVGSVISTIMRNGHAFVHVT